MNRICMNCGRELPNDSSFCPSCGTPVPVNNAQSNFCRKCGTQLPDGTAFCHKCGTPVGGGQDPTLQNNYNSGIFPVSGEGTANGVNAQQPTYPNMQSNYPNMQTNFPNAQPDYQNMQPNYPNAQPDYQNMQTNYPNAQPNYQNVQPDYPNMQMNNPAAYSQNVKNGNARTAARVKIGNNKIIIIAIAVIAIVIIVLAVKLISGLFKNNDIEGEFDDLCEMTSLGTQSYVYARMLTEQLLETDLATADPKYVSDLLNECEEAWKSTENVAAKMAKMSEKLSSNRKLDSVKGSSSSMSAVYFRPEDISFPFGITAHAYEDEFMGSVSETASPSESVTQCSKLAIQYAEDSQAGYNAVSSLRGVYSGRTTSVTAWNGAVASASSSFSVEMFVSGEITSGRYTQLTNGTHSVRTLSNSMKGGSKVLNLANELHKKFNGSEEDTKAQTIAKQAQAEIDKIEAEKKAEEERKAAEAAKSKEEKIKEKIRIGGVVVDDINSADGVSIQILWRNESNKDIKYLTFSVTPCNAVGDIVSSSIGGKTTANCRITGPLPTSSTQIDIRHLDNCFYYYSPVDSWEFVSPYNGTYTYTYRIFTDTWRSIEKSLTKSEMNNAFQSSKFDCVWYNNTITEIKINKVDIEYMDGTLFTVTEDEIKYAMG